MTEVIQRSHHGQRRDLKQCYRNKIVDQAEPDTAER